MKPLTPPSGASFPFLSASQLREDLSARARLHARATHALHDLSTSPGPVVVFGHDEHGNHGNFHPASYAAIRGNPAWAKRLAKVHTASRRSRARKDWQWRELDSCNSSDALLMNIFCHPGVFADGTLALPVARLLNVEAATEPCFGIRPGVPLRASRANRTGTGKIDRTEIDLQLGPLFVEAKLTESSFQTAPFRLIERYRDLETIFDVTRLPSKHLLQPAARITDSDADYSQEEYNEEYEPSGSNRLIENQQAETLTARFGERYQVSQDSKRPPQYQGYQLIRNVLAAYASDASFCVLCDARRHDLIETWYSILSTVHRPTFACRLKLLTWQELTTTLPADLQHFLAAKYGIEAA